MNDEYIEAALHQLQKEFPLMPLNERLRIAEIIYELIPLCYLEEHDND